MNHNIRSTKLNLVFNCWVKVLAIPHFVEAQTTGFTCEFTTGDGIGGTDERVGDETGHACVERCVNERKTNPMINGVTVNADFRKKGCWCESNMNSVDKEFIEYKTCLIDFEDQSTDYTCELTTGDGVGEGGSEIRIGDATGYDCVKLCAEQKKKDPSITGVTVFADSRPGCFCERYMNAIDKTSVWYKTCFIDIKVQFSGYTCKFTTGDGIGGTEQRFGSEKGYACIETCAKQKKKNPAINGVTVYASTSRRGCWCEINMKSINTADQNYKTCFLDLKDTCVFGVVRDGSQCCRIPKCPKNCLDNSRVITDNDGCPKCVCKNCNNVICPNNCKHGTIIKSENGCTCQCRTCARLTCPDSCEWGIETIKDADGCVQCICKQMPWCVAYRCPNYCSKGTVDVFDEDGCKTCICFQCPTYECPKICKLGAENVSDNRGCTRCVCKKQIEPTKVIPTRKAITRNLKPTKIGPTKHVHTGPRG